MRDPNKVTWRHVDDFLFGGAFTGTSKVAKDLAGAASDRLITHGMDYATGALVGRGTEWQRALLVTSKHRPTRRGDVVGTTEHPANVISAGEEVAVFTADDGVAYGVVEACDDDGIQLTDDWSVYAWSEITSIEAQGEVWTVYEGDTSRQVVVRR